MLPYYGLICSSQTNQSGDSQAFLELRRRQVFGQHTVSSLSLAPSRDPGNTRGQEEYILLQLNAMLRKYPAEALKKSVRHLSDSSIASQIYIPLLNSNQVVEHQTMLQKKEMHQTLVYHYHGIPPN